MSSLMEALVWAIFAGFFSVAGYAAGGSAEAPPENTQGAQLQWTDWSCGILGCSP